MEVVVKLKIFVVISIALGVAWLSLPQDADAACKKCLRAVCNTAADFGSTECCEAGTECFDCGNPCIRW